MFNAPDTWSEAGRHLPLGYFISRIAASKSAREGEVYTTMEALDAFIKSPGSYYVPSEGEENEVFNDNFINALFDLFALIWGGYWPSDTFKMNGVDNYFEDPSVLHVGNTFDGIYSNWPSRMDIVNNYEAVANEIGCLSSAANLLFEMPDRIKDKYPFTPRIVLFGHTHEGELAYHSGTNQDCIYANTGTWVDKKPRSWVEIEINHAGSRDFYTVSLWFDGESLPRQRATLDASDAYSLGLMETSSATALDFDGDGKADPAVYREETGYWNVILSGTWSIAEFKFGEPGYIPVPGDYDGDGVTDVAVYHEASGYWFVLPSSTWELTQQKFGEQGCSPAPADYDGDGKADLTVYHEESGCWYFLLSGSGYAPCSAQFGGPGYVPLTR